MLSIDDFKAITLEDKPVFDKHYEKYLKYYPGDSKAFLRTGICYALKKDYDNAVLYFEKTLRVDPDNSIAIAALKKYKKRTGSTYLAGKDNIIVVGPANKAHELKDLLDQITEDRKMG